MSELRQQLSTLLQQLDDSTEIQDWQGLLPQIRSTLQQAIRETETQQKAIQDLSLSLSQSRDLASKPPSITSSQTEQCPLEQVIEAIPIATVLVNSEGYSLHQNHALIRFFGLTDEHLAMIQASSFVDWISQRLEPAQAIQEHFNHIIQSQHKQKSTLKLQKENKPCEVIFHSLYMEEEAFWMICFEDLSAIHQLETKLKESEERFQLAAQGANDGLWDWHLKTNELYFSPRWLNMLGYSSKDFRNNLADWLNLVHPADKRELSRKLQEHLDRKSSRFRHEYRIRDKMGEFRWVLAQGMLIVDDKGEPHRFAGSQSDITEMKRMEKQLIHDSTHDLLTNLPNRLLFREELGVMMQKAAQSQHLSFAVLQLNLDQFQVINNGLGHLFGDQVLMVVAGRLLSLVESTDMVARQGGDEFAILLSRPQTSESVGQFAARLLAVLAEPLNVHGQEIVLSAGIGIVIHTAEHKNVGQLLGDAATAMHHAKAMSPGNWILFNQEMRSNAITRIQLESKLRRAIDQAEIKVFFQPIVDAISGKVHYFEALVRWFDPEKGLVNPGQFIPLAEETSLIVPLGDFVLRKACQEAIKWHSAGYSNLAVSVNLSPRQFQQPDLQENIAQILQETGMPGDKLTLEITESQIMENPGRAIEILKKLRSLGVMISIDDFGTGYSSLAYLKKFPINTLKIDQTFVEGLPYEHDDIEISRAIIALARSLKLDLVAEGVESPQQAQFLAQEGCPMIQGFLYSKPMPHQEVLQWLKHFKPERIHLGRE